MQKQVIPWDAMDDLLDELERQLRQRRSLEYWCVYGEPRGGLPFAVALAHRMSLTLYPEPTAHMIWVDDIVDSGNTYFARRREFPDAIYCAAFVRAPAAAFPQVIHAALALPNTWLVFPWEVDGNWQEDAEQYALSRE